MVGSENKCMLILTQLRSSSEDLDFESLLQHIKNCKSCRSGFHSLKSFMEDAEIDAKAKRLFEELKPRILEMTSKERKD